MGGLDEGTADVAVLNEAQAVGDARFLGVAHGGVQAGVGHADDDIGLHRMLLCQESAGPLAGLVDADALDFAVRPGEVDIFEHADFSLVPAVGGDGLHLAVLDDDDFAGAHVPHQGRADGVQRAALGGDHPGAVLGPADA